MSSLIMTRIKAHFLSNFDSSNPHSKVWHRGNCISRRKNYCKILPQIQEVIKMEELLIEKQRGEWFVFRLLPKFRISLDVKIFENYLYGRFSIQGGSITLEEEIKEENNDEMERIGLNIEQLKIKQDVLDKGENHMSSSSWREDLAHLLFQWTPKE